jgi:hypothetical protein
LGDNDLLKGIWQYLHDRNVPVDGGWLYRKKFIRVTRRKYTTCITVEGVVARLETDPIKPDGHFVHSVFRVDLNSPNSLQEIFEYVMSKRRK